MSEVPEIDIPLPRPVSAFHQIEITSHCNLRCVYCTNPNLQRPKMHMTREVYRRCLEWAQFYVLRHGQSELNLAGIGESTIHPDFIEYVRLAREAVGWGCDLVLATNGVAMTEELADALVPHRPKVFVSLHRPEKGGPAINMLAERGLLSGASIDPSVAAIDWAGQVDWRVTAPTMGCPWIREGWVMAMADGRLTTCCLDASGIGVVGHVDDEVGDVRVEPYELCKSCSSVIGIKGHKQWPDRALPVVK